MSTAQRVEILPKEHILIIDPAGRIGTAVARKLKSNYRVVLATTAKVRISGIYNVDLKPYKKQLPNLRYAYFLVYYSGEKYLLDMVPSLAKKAAVHGARLVIVLPATEVNTQLLHKIYFDASKAYIVVTGDAFGNLDGISLPSDIDTLLYHAKKNKKILLSEQGLVPFYPIAFADIVDGITRAMFHSFKHTQPLLLLPHVAYTEFSLARMLQKIDPENSIDFSSEPVSRQVVIPEGEYLLNATYPVQQKLVEAYEAVLLTTFPKEHQTAFQKKKPKKKKMVFTVRYGIVMLFFISIVLPFLLSLLLAAFGFLNLFLAKEQFTSGKTQFLLPETMLAQGSFYLADQSIKITQAEFGLIGEQNLLNGYTNLVTSAQIGTQVLHATISLLLPYENKTALSQNTFLQNINNVKTSLDAVTNAQTTGQLVGPVASFVASNQPTINFVRNTSDSWADLAGFSKPKTYLLLFQNNMELRPTGGFIGSYGMLTMQNGQITNFSIHNVYDADGQLKTHVEPPYPIRRYIPQVHLYLRDSNFDPDFPTSAKSAANLYNLETNTRVDGVIAVDLTFVKYLLSSLGSVYVPTYNQTVTADSLFLQTETHAEKNFTPGSTQKQDFLNALFLAMQQRLHDKKDISYQDLLTGFSQSLTEKHVLFAFNDSGAQNEFAANGYADSLIDERTPGQNAIDDYLAINEANIGVNKVNYYIKRKMSQSVSVMGDGTISDTVDLYYQNTSNGSWPGGVYKNYLRLLVPQNATITTISINGAKQTIVPAVTDFQTYEAKGFAPPQGLEVATSSELGKTVWGMLLTINPSSYQHITISYKLPQTISANQTDVYYNDEIVKQAGTPNDPMNFSLTTPQGYDVLIDNGVTNETSKDFHLSEDTDLTYHISKQ